MSTNGDVIVSFLKGSEPLKSPTSADYPTYDLVIYEVNIESGKEKSLEKKVNFFLALFLVSYNSEQCIQTIAYKENG